MGTDATSRGTENSQSDSKDASADRRANAASPDYATLLVTPEREMPWSEWLSTEPDLVQVGDAGAAMRALTTARIDCVLLDATALRPEEVDHLLRAASDASCESVLLTSQRRDLQTSPASRAHVAQLEISSVTPAQLQRAVVRAKSSASLRRRLNSHREELESSTYRLAHDLRAPVRRIRFLAEGAVGERSEAEVRASIVSAANEIDFLMDGFVRYVKADRDEVGSERVDLKSVVRNASQRIAELLEERGAEIECSELPSVIGDFEALTVLFESLFDNAVRFNDRRPLVQVSAARTGSDWTVSVRDNGIGIDATYLAKVFEPFARLHSSSRYKGAGLGLATCRRIARAHGGDIWAESSLDEGAVFRVRLPAPPHEA